jgi:hypothetical protein
MPPIVAVFEKGQKTTHQQGDTLEAGVSTTQNI